MDRKGGVKAIGIPPGAYSSPRVSPDDKRIAFSTNDGKDEIIWIYDLSGTGSVRRLTFEGSNRSPIWSPDSQRVAYSSTRRDGASILWQRADGSDVAEPLAEAGTTPIPEAWSPLGQTLAFSLYKPNNIFSVWFLSREDKKPLPFAQTGKYIARGTFSANGHWIAYQSDETGQPEIFVQPFPPTGTKYQISKGGGRHPVWSPDGRELFFNASSGVGVGKLSVVEIVTQPGFTFGNPAPIPLDGILDGIAISGRNYDITDKQSGIVQSGGISGNFTASPRSPIAMYIRSAVMLIFDCSEIGQAVHNESGSRYWAAIAVTIILPAYACEVRRRSSITLSCGPSPRLWC